MSKKAKKLKHIAIIPDGNRRWAKERGLLPTEGHKKSALENNWIENYLEICKQEAVKCLSIWGFSTENWKRDKREVDTLIELFKDVVQKWDSFFEREQVRFRHIGRRDRLPGDLIEIIERLEEQTKDNENMYFQLLLDYGGRDEILRAVNKMLSDGLTSIDEQQFSDYLDTATIPDPDLIIRTSGEKRLSGLFPFQAVYAELYFADVYFPDFDDNEFQKAIDDYYGRERRFGGS
jgi:undecaprenyl diphosphate synthase